MITHQLSDTLAVTLANTLRNDLAWTTFEARMQRFDDVPDMQGFVNGFVIIAAHTVGVNGVNWSPPPLSATQDELLVSFEQFLSVIDRTLLAAWMKAINDMKRAGIALASDDERGDNTEDPTTATSG
jgi:hypothetical protein